jgi:long-chain fatty acid transport protein
MRKLALLTSAFMLPAAMAFSAGYQLNLQGLRQLAMGGGGTAYPWDAATIFYNPGGLARMEGFQVYGSALAILPRVQFINEATGISERSVNKTFTPFNIYAGGTIKGVKGLGFGVGVYTPFGSGVTWDDNWSGRYVTQSIYLQSIFVQPTVSYKINDALSIGAGYVYAFGHVELARALPVPPGQSGAPLSSGQIIMRPDGRVELDGKANGMGYNLGVSLKASEKLHFGISYRSRVDMHVKNGEAKFDVASSVRSNFPNTSFDATLPLPEVFSVGMAWKPLPKFTVQVDFNLTGWKAYDSLAFNYGQAVNGQGRSSDARLYQNRLASRLGFHYQATPGLEIMFGGAYDPSPVRDGFVTPDLPDANRVVGTAGFVWKPAPKFSILAVVEYVSSERRDARYDEVGLNGRYQTKAITPGLGVSYDF